MGYVTKDLQQLNVTTIDLMLFHHPCSSNASNVAVWGFLQSAVKQKMVRSIGISNFNAGQMAALLEMTAKDPTIVPPSVNQCGMHSAKDGWVARNSAMCPSVRPTPLAVCTALNRFFSLHKITATS